MINRLFEIGLLLIASIFLAFGLCIVLISSCQLMFGFFELHIGFSPSEIIIEGSMILGVFLMLGGTYFFIKLIKANLL